MKTLITRSLIIALTCVCIILNSCNHNNTSVNNTNQEFKECIGEDLYNLIENAETHLDNYVNRFYYHDNIQESYKLFINSWDSISFEQLLKNIDKKTKNTIIDNAEIRQIWDRSLNLGDSIFFAKPMESEKLINPIQFNFMSNFSKCLSISTDSIALSYHKLKETGLNIQFNGLVGSFNQYINEGKFNNDILKKLIVIEFYLKPLAMTELK